MIWVEENLHLHTKGKKRRLFILTGQTFFGAGRFCNLLSYYEAIAVFTIMRLCTVLRVLGLWRMPYAGLLSSGWPFPVTEDKVEDNWRDRGRDQHLARGERGLV